jgi:exopolysaccharide production protein ExoY
MAYRITDPSPGTGGSELDLALSGSGLGDRNFGCKRAADMVIAGVALALTMPLLIIVALLIKLTDGGPAVFAQERYGLNGRKFRCYKLRTMVPDARERLEQVLAGCPKRRDEWQRTEKLSNDPRITWIGGFLRKTSIDELPQLINILRGDMSIVGPRPIQQHEIIRYRDAYRYYVSVRPGLTGLWQISGRSDTSYQYRVHLDLIYIQNRTFWGDVLIMLKTVPAVLFSRGAK